MKYSILVTVMILLISCRHNTAYITESERKMFKPYIPGDTICFASSKHMVDTFLVAGMDSSRTTDMSLIGLDRHQNHVYIFIRKLPRVLFPGRSAEFFENSWVFINTPMKRRLIIVFDSRILKGFHKVSSVSFS